MCKVRKERNSTHFSLPQVQFSFLKEAQLGKEKISNLNQDRSFKYDSGLAILIIKTVLYCSN